jgi:hypothetical protein
LGKLILCLLTLATKLKGLYHFPLCFNSSYVRFPNCDGMHEALTPSAPSADRPLDWDYNDAAPAQEIGGGGGIGGGGSGSGSSNKTHKAHANCAKHSLNNRGQRVSSGEQHRPLRRAL